MNEDRRQAARKLERSIDNRSASCAVVGLGFIGTTVGRALATAGFDVRGYDRDPSAVERWKKLASELGPTAGRFQASGDPTVLAGAQVVIVAVRLPVGSDGTVETEPLRQVAKDLAADAPPERLVVLESTLPPGTTRKFAEPFLADGARHSFIAHCPDRLSVGHGVKEFREMPHLVGGIDVDSGRLAAALYAQLCDQVVPVSSPEISELSKLLENTFITVGISLVAEVTRLAHALGVTAREVTEAAATKRSGYYPFHPGAGIGGHCLPPDLRILIDTAHRNGCDVPLLDATAVSVERQPSIVDNRLAQLVAQAEKSLDGARVLLVGVGFKIGSADTTATPASEIVRLLRKRGTQVAYLDSAVKRFEVDGNEVERVGTGDLRPGGFLAAVILAGDHRLTGAQLRETTPIILDTGGGSIVKGLGVKSCL